MWKSQVAIFIGGCDILHMRISNFFLEDAAHKKIIFLAPRFLRGTFL